MVRGEPGETAARLIALRRAEVVRAPSADAFFGKLAEDVASLEDLGRPHPLSAPAAKAAVKRYLVEPCDRIRLDELVMEEAERIHGALTGPDALPLHVPPTGEDLVERLRRYEAVSEVMVAIMATGCRWGEAAHHSLWARCLGRLAILPNPIGMYYEAWTKLRRYPALLALYAGGIAAVAADRYDTFAALLTGSSVRYPLSRGEEPVVLAVNSWDVMEIVVERMMPGKERNFVPLNDHVFFGSGLREVLRDVLVEDAWFQETFDRFEYLLGLVHADQNQKLSGSWWAPDGCFAWRNRADFSPDRMEIVQTVVAEVDAQGESWPPLQVGLFDASVDRLREVMTDYHQSISARRH